MITVKAIVRKWLEDNGYSGLITDGCGCTSDDLFPCGGDGVIDGEGCPGCFPGYAGKSGYVYGTKKQSDEDIGIDGGGQESCP